MARWRCRLLLLLALAVVRGTAAAGDAPLGPAAEYRFAPGDVIEVTVTPQRGFDRTVTVQPDGKITYPIVGQVEAAGQTVKQLAEVLQQGLNQELVDPVVSVSLREASRREIGRISLLGAVRNPGSIEIRENTTLADALAAVGGPAPLAELRRVTVTHASGETVTADLSQTDRTGRVESNLRLQAGDVIIVPEGERPTILVLGAVAKPGSYELPRGARLLDGIALAGGSSDLADLSRITLTRQKPGDTKMLDLLPLLTKGDTSNPELNVLLQPGDTLFIAHTAQQIYVLGAVTKPGLYPIKASDRVMDALVTAGGAGAAARKAVLVRRDAQGNPVSKSLDLKKMMARGDVAENELLRPGDVLYVSDNQANRRATTTAILDNILRFAAITALF
jgi:polysaccharide export outer membrane protein